jgi:ABC-type nitrate/sulfonate/bicarbonate transport system substrate-binding protein
MLWLLLPTLRFGVQMKFPRFGVLTFVAILFVSPAGAKEKMTYGSLLDPIVEAFTYAITAGKVTSDLIDIEITEMSIPTAIQATATKQYDVIQTAAIGIPRAAAKGLDLKVLSVATRYPQGSRGGDIWVLPGSPYKTIKDLRGKTIAVNSFDSTGTTWIRLAIWKKYGMNVLYENGDFQWVEIAAGGQLGALTTGRVDATTLMHSQALMALETGKYRSIESSAADNFELYKIPSVAAVNVSYPEKLVAKPKEFMEFNRMLKASRDYALTHMDEVAQAVFEKSGLPRSFFKEWVEKIGDFPATIGDADIESLGVNWVASKELGIISSYPDPKSVVWEHALRPE